MPPSPTDPSTRDGSAATATAATDAAPYYLPIADEIEVFQAAYDARLPVLLKGPTGCGKTRFVEAMAWQLFGPSEPTGSRSSRSPATKT